MTTPATARSAHPRFLAGSGRGGTTWLLDTLAEANGLRTVFEPLHPQAAPAAASLAYRYVPPKAQDPVLYDFMRKVARGEFSSVWSDYRVRPDRLRVTPAVLISPKRLRELRRRWSKLWRHRQRYKAQRKRSEVLVKCIRANLMLGWLCERLGARTVLLLRHPGAVVESRLRLGAQDWAPAALLDRYRRDERLLTALPTGCRELLGESLSPLEQLALLWCVENELPLRQAASDGVHVVCYEHLLAGDDQSWASLLHHLELEHRPSAAQLARPSQQAAAAPEPATGTARITRWQERLAPTDVDALASILARVGHGVYRADRAEPDAAALTELLQPAMSREKRGSEAAGAKATSV